MRLINSTNIYYYTEDGERCVQFDTHDETELALLFWEYLKEDNEIEIEKGKTEYDTGVMVEFKAEEEE